MSKRVANIGTDPYEKSLEWLFSYANYVHLDMYIGGGSYSFNPFNILSPTPANRNYKIAYTFGVYDEDTLNKTGIHFIGASESNNTPHTLENTYIGSYFKANNIKDKLVLKENMRNYLAYVEYLIEPEKYTNPTLDSKRTPLLPSESGIYHPDYGIVSYSPSQELVNQWILSNPGYNADGYGSLNWEVQNLSEWKKENADPSILLKEFERWYKVNKNIKTPFIVLASYYGGEKIVDSLIKKYESRGRAAFNFFSEATNPSMSSILLRLAQESSFGISAVNSLYSWSLNYANLNRSGALENLTNLDLSILQSVNKISEKSYNNTLGPQMEWTYAVTIPSFEGSFGAIVLSYIDDKDVEHVIDSSVEKLVDLTIGWANLKEKNNSDKRVSIILYNYPPGKSEIGASYLDVFKSIREILEKMYDEGFDIGMDKEEIPSVDDLYMKIAEMGNKASWSKGLLNKYVEDHWDTLMANKQLVNLEQYYKYLSSLDSELQKQLINYWNDGLGEIMVYNNSYILITGLLFGNVFITFQPSRGWEEVENYHDLTLPPHQQYITFYKWLDETFKTDVNIHLGTHGTLEFLPGRSIGLQADDWSFALTLNPTVYPYIVSNPGEGMVAKDRLGSLIITHMTPAIVTSSLYGDYVVLSDYITRYENAIKVANYDGAKAYEDLIIDYAKKLSFRLPESTDEEVFARWLEDLHIYLEAMANDINAFGLHSIGQILEGESLIQEVVTIVSSRTDVYNEIIKFLYPELATLDFYDDLSTSSKYTEQVTAIRDWLNNFVSELVYSNKSCDDLAIKYNINKSSDLYDMLLFSVETILDIKGNMEWESFFNALNGSFVQPGLFVDPAYGDSLSTGKNGYASDSSKMPSKAAYLAAKKIVDLLLVNYYTEHNKWPELVSLILWGTEILRTEGIGIAQFLYFLGCKPVWSKTGTVTGIEVIPLDELTIKMPDNTIVKRPRIDVFSSMVTSNIKWISLMVNAVNAVIFNTPEEDSSVNFAKKTYEETGSSNRLFGLPGNILEGTGMSDYIPNTNKWQNNANVGATLVDIYMDRVSNSWSLDENGEIVITKNKDEYSKLVSKVNLITQNLDSTWRFLDSDDYYDWFGGLLAAAQYHGAKPDTALVDIRNKNNFVSRTLKEQLEIETRTNLLNPKFVDELFKTASGANEYAGKIEHLFGIEVLTRSTGGEGLISDGLYDALSNNLMDISNRHVNHQGKAVGWMAAAGWMIYFYEKGYWKTDTNTITKIVNRYMETVIDYNVACCHHTCANINFNDFLVQVSTLSNAQKQEFSDILQAATLSRPVFTSPDSQDNSDSQESPDDTSNNDQSSQESGTSTPVGESNNDAQALSSDSSSQSQTQGESNEGSSAGASDSKAYELSKSTSSASKSSSMPIYFIIAVIVLIAVFALGYIRGRNNDEEE